MAGFVFIEADADGTIDATKKAQVRSRCMQGVNRKQDSRRSIRKANRAAKEKDKEAAANAQTASVLVSGRRVSEDGGSDSSRGSSVAGSGRWTSRGSSTDPEDDEPEWYPVNRRALADLATWRKPHLEMPPLDVHLFQFGGSVDKGKAPFLLHVFVIFETFQSKESIFNVVDFSNFFYDRARWLATDDLFFQSALCTMSHMLDFMRGNKPTKLTLFHTHQTMYMLNRRLSRGGAHADEAVFWIVLGLALLAALQEDYGAAMAHIAALGKIVELRGGLERVTSMHPKIHHKLEALDTLVCMSRGKRPGFFMSQHWETSHNNMMPPAPSPPPPPAHAPAAAASGNARQQRQQQQKQQQQQQQRFVLPQGDFDPILTIAFRDLQHLTSLMNGYIEQNSLIDAPTFQRSLSSITSRLLHLSGTLPVPSPSSAVCHAILAQITSLFAIPARMLRLEYLTNQLKRSGAESLGPLPLRLWIAVACGMQILQPDDEWLQGLWDGVAAGGMGWSEAKKMLRSVIWVDRVHEENGQRAFEALQEVRRQRIANAHRGKPVQYSFVV